MNVLQTSGDSAPPAKMCLKLTEAGSLGGDNQKEEERRKEGRKRKFTG